MYKFQLNYCLPLFNLMLAYSYFQPLPNASMAPYAQISLAC